MFSDSKDNPRFNNKSNNLGKMFSGSKDNPRFNSKNTLSLKENLKEKGKKNRIESRMTKDSLDDHLLIIVIFPMIMMLTSHGGGRGYIKR